MALTKTQLEERKHFIGSSDAKIIASGDYVEWHELMSQKAGILTKAFTKEQRILMDAGSHLESFILDCFNDVDKLPDIRSRNISRNRFYEAIPIHSTLDAITVTGSPVEAKAHFMRKDIDELAEFYAPQCQHHMFVTDKDACYMPVFFGHYGRFEYRKLLRDDTYIEAYLENCKLFWKWYEDGVPPTDYNPLPPIKWEEMVTIRMEDLEFFDSKFQSEMNLNAQAIIDHKKSKIVDEQVKTEIKHYLPADAKKMTLNLSGNHAKGSQLIVTRSQNGRETVTVKEPRGDKNADS